MTKQTNGYKINMEKRITTLEANYQSMDKKLDSVSDAFNNFINNHFEHFKDDVFAKIEGQKGVQPWVAVLFTVGGSVVATLITYVVTHLK